MRKQERASDREVKEAEEKYEHSNETARKKLLPTSEAALAGLKQGYDVRLRAIDAD